jgi:hypothetical protein
MAKRHECANCGRDVRDLPDSERRFEGGRWFCSQSCFLTAESFASRNSIRKASKPRHKWRRRIGWTVGVMTLLIVALGVLGALIGSTSTSKAPAATTASHTTSHRSGSAAHPIPIGRYAAIGNGWRTKVVSVLRHVRQQTLGLGKEQLPPGAENIVVKITVKWIRGGSGNSQAVVNEMNAIGAHKAVYHADGICTGNAEFGDGGLPVFSGQTATGTACFRIAKNDDSTLRLYINSGSFFESKASASSTWFTLR